MARIAERFSSSCFSYSCLTELAFALDCTVDLRGSISLSMPGVCVHVWGRGVCACVGKECVYWECECVLRVLYVDWVNVCSCAIVASIRSFEVGKFLRYSDHEY